MTDLVRISSTGAGVNYYPEFVARHLGFYAEEGLQVEVEVLGNGPGVPRAVGSDAADLGLGGIWLPMLYRGRLDTFIPFAQLCNRLAAVLLTRAPMSGFQWADLRGKITLSPGGAPNFWMVVAAAMRAAGADPCSVRFIPDFVGDEVINLFRGGFGDFLISMPPVSDRLVAAGTGVVVYDFADLGDLPWSIFYAKPEFLARPDRAARRFARAIRRGLNWVFDHDPAEAPLIFEACFPNDDPELIAAAVRACRARGVWSRDVRIPEPALMNWQSIILQEGRLIDAPMAYGDIVDARPAAWADGGPD
jgi:NitT/TauT family transport system substrate-binding protein